jgi:hypothetical protein
MNALQAQATDLTEQFGQMQNIIAVLKEDSTKFHSVRQRFLSTYKRDYLCTRPDDPPESDRQWINTGNTIAHEGDAKFDASLYLERIPEKTPKYSRARTVSRSEPP